MTFQEWFNSEPHRAKYSNDHPAYLAAQEAWEAAHEACAKVAETPVGEYEVIVACGTEPTPRRIPRYLECHDIAKAIRARGQFK